MDKQRFFRCKLVAAVAAVFGAIGTAMAADEVEPNGSIGSAQRLEVLADGSGTGSAMVTGVVGTTSGAAVQDVDFYSFYAVANDTVTVNIDGAYTSFDTHIYLFGPDQTELAYNDDAASYDAGSPAPSGTLDSRIDTFVIPQTGIYTVAVTGYGVFLGAGGTYSPYAVSGNGSYNLTISGVSLPPPPPPAQAPAPTPEPTPEPAPAPTPLAQKINIAFKPDERKALTHPQRRGDIHVLLVSSRTFNAYDVDVTSVRFGPTGTEASPKRCNWHGERANHDRRGRMLCHFDANAVGFRADDAEGVLTGTTRSGQAFEGRRELKIADKKKEKDRDRDDQHRERRDRDERGVKHQRRSRDD